MTIIKKLRRVELINFICGKLPQMKFTIVLIACLFQVGLTIVPGSMYNDYQMSSAYEAYNTTQIHRNSKMRSPEKDGPIFLQKLERNIQSRAEEGKTYLVQNFTKWNNSPQFRSYIMHQIWLNGYKTSLVYNHLSKFFPNLYETWATITGSNLECEDCYTVYKISWQKPSCKNLKLNEC